MKKKWHSPDQIIRKLREAEGYLSAGMTIGHATHRRKRHAPVVLCACSSATTKRTQNDIHLPNQTDCRKSSEGTVFFVLVERISRGARPHVARISRSARPPCRP